MRFNKYVHWEIKILFFLNMFKKYQLWQASTIQYFLAQSRYCRDLEIEAAKTMVPVVELTKTDSCTIISVMLRSVEWWFTIVFSHHQSSPIGSSLMWWWLMFRWAHLAFPTIPYGYNLAFPTMPYAYYNLKTALITVMIEFDTADSYNWMFNTLLITCTTTWLIADFKLNNSTVNTLWILYYFFTISCFLFNIIRLGLQNSWT